MKSRTWICGECGTPCELTVNYDNETPERDIDRPTGCPYEGKPYWKSVEDATGDVEMDRGE